jgi:hypothetical protein
VDSTTVVRVVTFAEVPISGNSRSGRLGHLA